MAISRSQERKIRQAYGSVMAGKDAHDGQNRLSEAILAHKHVAAMAPRRWGKTEGVIRHGLRHGWRRIAFFDDEPKYAYRTIEPIAFDLEAKYGVAVGTNRSENVVRIGQMDVVCGGYSEHKQVQAHRGKKYDAIVIDEAQKGALHDLAYYMESDLAQCLTDTDGVFIMTFTAGEIDSGLAYHVSKLAGVVSQDNEVDVAPEVRRRTVAFARTFRFVRGRPFENPAVSEVQRRRFEERIAQDPEYANLPHVRREIFAEWVGDRAGLVLSFEERHFIDRWEPRQGDDYLLSVDFGFSPDPCSFTLTTTNPDVHDKLILLDNQEHLELTDDDIVAVIMGYASRFPSLRVVYDSGGTGKRHVGIPLSKCSVPHRGADKRVDERITMRTLNTMLRQGRLCIGSLDGSDPRDGRIAKYYGACKWVMTRKGLEVGKPRHLNDTLRYALYESRHEQYEDQPPEDTPEMAALKAAMQSTERRS